MTCAASLSLSATVSSAAFADQNDAVAIHNSSDAVAAATCPEWLALFNDPILTRVVGRALASSPTLDGVAARFDQARAAARATRASLLPNIGAGAGATAFRQSLDDEAIRAFAGAPGFVRDIERFDARVTAAWELDIFGAAPRTRSARARVLVARYGIDAARITVASDVATAYFNVRELEQRLTIAKARSDSLTRKAEVLRLRVAAGVIALLDAERFEAERQSADAAVPVLEALLAGERARLGVLAGDPSVVAFLAETRPLPGAATYASPTFAATELVIEQRPDVLAASFALTAADADISAARSQRFPRISLGGLLATIASGPGGLFTAAASSASGQGGLIMPLFDFGRIDAAIAQAKGAQRVALADYRATLLRASADVETTTVALARRQEEARRHDNASASAERALTIASTTYAAGALDLTTLLDTDRASLAANEGAVIARADVARALVAIFRATDGSRS